MILKINKMSLLRSVDNYLILNNYESGKDFRWLSGPAGIVTPIYYCELEIFNEGLANILILKFFT